VSAACKPSCLEDFAQQWLLRILQIENLSLGYSENKNVKLVDVGKFGKLGNIR
jgi:hypothetical protein